MSYALVHDQRSMALDLRRNKAYANALTQIVTPETVVLDLGAGLGIHGLLAAQLGAKRVYLVEPEDIITIAGEIAQRNGYGDCIHCLRGKIEEIGLPEPVDIITSVFTGNFLLEEDLLPSLLYARDHFLKPGGALIPQAGIMQAVPVYAPELYGKEIEHWSQAHLGIDLSAARSYASNSMFYYRDELAKAEYLAEPVDLLFLDFHQATDTHCQINTEVTVTKAGLCHGWIGWFTMQLGDTWLSTAPHAPPLHWSAAFLPLDPPISVAEGETIHLTLKRPPFSDWSWSVATPQTQQAHSTFWAAPMTLDNLKKLAFDYQPTPNDKGKAALYVLSHSDGTVSVEALSQTLLTDYPQLFPNLPKAIKFVQNLVGFFA